MSVTAELAVVHDGRHSLFRFGQGVSSDRASSLRLRRQWIVSSKSHPPLPHFRSTRVSTNYWLHHHPDTTLRLLQRSTATLAIIGHAVFDDRDDPAEAVLADLDSWQRCDLLPLLDSLVGIYALIRADEASVDIITDPAGMMGVYYSDHEAASTPVLVAKQGRDSSVDSQYSLRGSDNWYTGSLTPFRGVRAVLANHVFELPSGRGIRFWPRQTPPSLRPADGVEECAARMRCSIRGLSRAAPLLASVTGGYDSRVYLAALASEEINAECFTIAKGRSSDPDLEIASRLVRMAGMKHAVLPWSRPEPWLYELYDAMTGGLSTGGRREAIGACAPAAGPYVHINGNLGAIAKAFYWPVGHPREVRMAALMHEFCNKAPCIRDGVEEWLRSVPDLPPHVVYNLMYMEQRGGRWMGIGETAGTLFYDSFSPFCSRRFFEIVSGMPLDYQQQRRCLADLVRVMAPRLADVPYHSGTASFGRWLPKRVKNALRRVFPSH